MSDAVKCADLLPIELKAPCKHEEVAEKEAQARLDELLGKPGEFFKIPVVLHTLI